MGSSLSSLNLETIQHFVDSLSSKEQYKLKLISDESDFTESFENPIQLNPRTTVTLRIPRSTKGCHF